MNSLRGTQKVINSSFVANRREVRMSLAMLLPPLGLPGVLVYATAQGGLPWALLAGVALGFSIGAYLGARISTALNAARLSRGFGLMLLLLAVLMAWRR